MARLWLAPALIAPLMFVAAAEAQRGRTPMPPPAAMVATLNSTPMQLDASKVAPIHEQALCVHATDTLIAKGDWDFMKPVSEYWNAQFAKQLPAESDRPVRMKEAEQRLSAFLAYPDAKANLLVHVAVVNRCERAMKLANGST